MKDLGTFEHSIMPHTSSGQSSGSSADWLYALETADHFNALLADFGPEMASEDDEGGGGGCPSVVRTLIHGRGNRGSHLHENFAPSAALVAARPITSSRILQASPTYSVIILETCS